jgi:hypothetical protein
MFSYSTTYNHDYIYDLTYDCDFEYSITYNHNFVYDLARLATDPATGQTWLFEGGYFRHDGVFVRDETFNRN